MPHKQWGVSAATSVVDHVSVNKCFICPLAMHGLDLFSLCWRCAAPRSTVWGAVDSCCLGRRGEQQWCSFFSCCCSVLLIALSLLSSCPCFLPFFRISSMSENWDKAKDEWRILLPLKCKREQNYRRSTRFDPVTWWIRLHIFKHIRLFTTRKPECVGSLCFIN